MKIGPAVAVGALIVLAGCVGGLQSPQTISQERVTAPCAVSLPGTGFGADQPPDPANDRLGWENGVWYDETIDVNQADGLTCDELELVLAQTMARVEHLRGLEFEETPTVELVTRRTFQRTAGGGSVPENYRTLSNVKYEALFMIDESEDAVSVQGENQGVSIAAFYQPAQDAIVFITPGVPQVDTTILAHELVHALQDQHFDLASLGTPYEDVRNARRGLIEGDANYVEHLYSDRCEEDWAGSCLSPDLPEAGGGSGGGGLANVGPYLLTYQPYSDGPAFISGVRDRSGWSGVNDLYAEPPESTEQIIHPARYPGDEPIELTVADTSTRAWTPVTFGPLDQERLGEAGLFAMFLYPSFHSQGSFELATRANFTNRGDDGSVNRLDPFNYASPYSDGWDGDALVAYENDRGQTGYVWLLAFDSEADAQEFAAGYRSLLAYHDANQVDGREGVYVIPEGQSFSDAFYVGQTGDRVTVVNAPTVAELAEIRPEVSTTG